MIKIGWGRRTISMDERVSLPGQMYFRLSEGVMDPLYATALCIEGENVAVMCTCDIVHIQNNILEPVRTLVKEMRPELPVETIILCATHTHNGVGVEDTPETTPDGQRIYPGRKCREFFIRQCAEAICEAWDRRAEGAVACGYGYAAVAHSRRVVYFDDTSLREKANPVAPNGHAVMYGDTNHEQFSHYEAGTDHFLNALFTLDKNRKLTGIVINLPCPSQITEDYSVQTSDYWNEVRQLVAAEYGEDVYVLPQCAAAGDLSPHILHYKKAHARRMELKYGIQYDATKMTDYATALAERSDIAQRIMEGIRDIYGWAQKDIWSDVPVYHKVETILLPRRRITDEEKQWCEGNVRLLQEQLAQQQTGTPEEIRETVSFCESVCKRNQRIIDQWKAQDRRDDVPMECHIVRIGNMAFATNMFELYMDYMHRIQARSPFVQTFVVQLAGAEENSYLATDRAVQNKGYSASMFCNQVGPEGGQVLVEKTVEMLKELYNK